MLIDDPNRQAEAWGACAAAYQIISDVLKSDSAQAKQFHNLSIGASVAVVMTHVSAGLKDDMSQERFNALWGFSKTLMDSVPEVQRTTILADAESLGKSGKSAFIEKLGATLKICTANLDGQQAYIDMWRELAKSGMLILPSD